MVRHSYTGLYEFRPCGEGGEAWGSRGAEEAGMDRTRMILAALFRTFSSWSSWVPVREEYQAGRGAGALVNLGRINSLWMYSGSRTPDDLRRRSM